MDKNAIKKYAVWARRELISRVSQRAALYDITEKNLGDPSADSVNGQILTAVEKKERQALIKQIQTKGYQEVMEEVAYTWFNRFSALRFMEVNGYLPSHVRVFTDDENAFKPQILTEAINLDLEGLDMEKVYALKNANDNDELFKYLIIVQCNALSEILPGMFQRIADYTELLFPDNLLREGSAVEQMIAFIPEEDWREQVQIIGWLYQAYYSEAKDERINAHKQYKKSDIPFVTQLFTPDWIVHYMVENALGRYWIEQFPDEELKKSWKYYLDDLQKHENKKRYINSPEDIKCIDNCMGSGHILDYMFDVLMQIYENQGYATKDAVASIIENNIYGLDIDDRAAQLAYFSVMMKACQYDRRFLKRKIQPHLYSIVESNSIDLSTVEYFCDGKDDIEQAVKCIINDMENAKEYGSMLKVRPQNWELLYSRIEEINNDVSLFKGSVEYLFELIRVAEVLSCQYDVVVTNPPYMNSSLMPEQLKNYVFTEYADYKTDVFAVFIIRNLDLCKQNGQLGFLAPYVWMFNSTYEKFREELYNKSTITSLVQLEYNAFEAACVPVASFTLSKNTIHGNGQYIKLSEFKGVDNQEPKTLEAVRNRDCGYRYEATQEDFKQIAGQPISYWASDIVYSAFNKGTALENIAEPRQGVKTLDNDRFLKLWFEIPYSKIEFHAHNQDEASSSGKKWFPYNKGGEYRRWYGNNYYVVNWGNDGFEMKQFAIEKYGCVTRTITNISYFYKPGLTWSALTTGAFSIRWFDEGFLFDSKGSSMYFNSDKERAYIIGFMNSKVASHLLGILAPTLDFNVGPMKKLPILFDEASVDEITRLVTENVNIVKEDWDKKETSWNYKSSPLLNGEQSIEMAYEKMTKNCQKRLNKLKENEEQLNKIFISIYGLIDELSYEVMETDINITIPTVKESIKDFISYAIGCVLGRYSLDTEGIVYAGGIWDIGNYKKYIPDSDGIIPICDDEYFDDDIVGLFIKFVESVFGPDNIENNLTYIAKALGGSGSSREVLRSYFINDYYKDHCALYSVIGAGKRPIYWMFDSGKKNGFKCLVYMHRYQQDTIARIRTDYVHEQQSRYRTAIADLENRIASASTSERVKLSKQLKKLQEQAEETRGYEEKIHHLADQMIPIDLDDGVKVNYAKFQDVLAKIK